MRFSLISISQNVLSLESIENVTVPTKDGEITVGPHHEPLISALKPGVLIVRHDGTEERFAIGGGVLETNGESCNILSDMVAGASSIDLNEIEKRHVALHTEMEAYRANNETVDMETLVEMEQEYLREAAKIQLARG